MVVEPSGFQTDWAGSSMTVQEIPAAYAPTVGAMSRMRDRTPAGDPDRAAEIIVAVVRRGDVPSHLLLGVNAVEMSLAYSRRQLEEAAAWEKVSRSAGHGGALPRAVPRPGLLNSTSVLFRGEHHVGPRAVPRLRRPPLPPVPRPDRQGRGSGAATGRRPRLRSGASHRRAVRAMAESGGERVDSSAEMVAAARQRGIAAEQVDVRDWTPPPDADVVVTNAVLQWVPGHLDLLPGWLAALPSRAWFALQVPGNFGAPSHALVRELAAGRVTLRGEASVSEPGAYAEVLAAAGADVDVWETTYHQRLIGADPVLHWMRRHGPAPGPRRPPARRIRRLPRRIGSAPARRLSGQAGRHDLVPVPSDLRGGAHPLNARVLQQGDIAATQQQECHPAGPRAHRGPPARRGRRRGGAHRSDRDRRHGGRGLVRGDRAGRPRRRPARVRGPSLGGSPAPAGGRVEPGPGGRRGPRHVLRGDRELACRGGHAPPGPDPRARSGMSASRRTVPWKRVPP